MTSPLTFTLSYLIKQINILIVVTDTSSCALSLSNKWTIPNGFDNYSFEVFVAKCRYYKETIDIQRYC